MIVNKKKWFEKLACQYKKIYKLRKEKEEWKSCQALFDKKIIKEWKCLMEEKKDWWL